MSLHDEGRFTARITGHGYSMKKKGPQLWVSFSTDVGGITGFFSFSDAAAQYSVKKVRAMGYTGEDLGELGDGQCMNGNECEITIAHELDMDGKPRASVQFVDPVGGGGWNGGNDPDAALSVRSFNALLRTEKAVAKAEPVGHAAYTEANPPPPQDDGYPF